MGIVRYLIKTGVVVLGTGVAIISIIMAHVFVSFGGTYDFPADCALVFGATVHSIASPGPGIRRRVETAVHLYDQHYVRKLVFTGGKGDSFKHSEAAVMRDYALQLGVSPFDIRIEDQSTSTWENLIFSKQLLDGCASIVGVSDRYHLARISYLAKLQGWGTLQTFPASNHPAFLFELKSVVREAFGFVYYTLDTFWDTYYVDHFLQWYDQVS